MRDFIFKILETLGLNSWNNSPINLASINSQKVRSREN